MPQASIPTYCLEFFALQRRPVQPVILHVRHPCTTAAAPKAAELCCALGLLGHRARRIDAVQATLLAVDALLPVLCSTALKKQFDFLMRH